MQESLQMFDFNLERAASYLAEQQSRQAAVEQSGARKSASPTSAIPAIA